MHFEISMRKVAQGLQGGSGGGHRRTPFWTPNNSPNRRKRPACARSFEFRPSVKYSGNRWHPERRVARIRPDIKDVFKLHHDNAPSHTAFDVTNYLTQSKTPVVPQPPYSPDLAPCDFFCSPDWRESWRESTGSQWRTSKLTLQSSSEAFQLRSSRVHSMRGRIVSASVLMQEETSLKIFNHLYQSHQ